MLVYHSEAPCALKGQNKAILPVYWKWKKRAWVTQEVFLNWYTNYFCPTVLCVKRMSCQPRRFFSLTMPLAILQTLLKPEHLCMTVFFTCHQTPYHFAASGPGGSSNPKSPLLLPSLHGNDESFGQVRQNSQNCWHSFDILKGFSKMQLGRKCP